MPFVLVGLVTSACDFPWSPKEYRLDHDASFGGHSNDTESLIHAFSREASCGDALRTSCSGNLTRCAALDGCVEFTECVRDLADPVATTKCTDRLGTSLEAHWAYEDLARCWTQLGATCSVGTDFSCLRTYLPPHAERTTFTISQRVRYLQDEARTPDFSFSVCALGTDCSEPLAQAPLDSEGRYTVTVPWGASHGGPGSSWEGYRLLQSPLIPPSRVESNLPIWGTRVEVTRVLSRGQLELLARLHSAERQEAVFVQVLDCKSAPAPGIRVTLGAHTPGEVGHDDGGETTNATGSAALYNLETDTLLEALAHRADTSGTTKVVARWQGSLPPGHVIYVKMHPEPR